MEFTKLIPLLNIYGIDKVKRIRSEKIKEEV